MKLLGRGKQVGERWWRGGERAEESQGRWGLGLVRYNWQIPRFGAEVYYYAETGLQSKVIAEEELKSQVYPEDSSLTWHSNGLKPPKSA